jgi:ABC-type antimicrobial peptide transport system permease subunit
MSRAGSSDGTGGNRGAAYREIDEELRYHLDRRTDELIAEGKTPRAARRQAIREFGSLARYRRDCLRIHKKRRLVARWGETLDTLRQDIGFAARQYARAPGFTLVAALTLALGIGATTVVFSVVNSVVLRRLPFAEPERLVRIWEVTPQGRYFSSSEPNYLDWRQMSPGFEEMAAFTEGALTLTGAGEPRIVRTLRASHTLLPTLGINPVLGRGFLPEEDQPGGNWTVVLLSRAFWEAELGADPEILGRTLTLNDRPYTVIGVTPLPTVLRGRRDMIVPLAPDPTSRRGNHFLKVVARLAAGVSPQQAGAAMDQVAEQLSEQYPESNQGWGTTVEPFEAWLVGNDVSRTVLLLLGAVGFLLVLACVNVSNLLIARGTARRKELAVRAALGANRSRIIRQLLIESAILAVLGALGGLLVTTGAVPIVQTLGPVGIPRLDEVSVDRSVLGFSVLVTVLTALLAGLSPALQAIGRGLHDSLREGSRATGSRGGLRDALVVAELALAVVLLAGAGLMMQSLLRLRAVDPGFDLDSVVSVPLLAPAVFAGTAAESGESVAGEGQAGESAVAGGGAAQDPAAAARQAAERQAANRRAFYTSVLERVEALPGVVSAGVINIEPLSGDDWTGIVAAGAVEPETQEEYVMVQGRMVTPRLFEAMGIPLLRGRLLTDRDMLAGAAGQPPPVINVLVSEGLADALWPEGDAVGENLVFGRGSESQFVVAGIVADIRDRRLDATPPPMIYFHYGNQPPRGMTLLVRTAADPAALMSAIRAEIREIAPTMPISEIRLLEDHLNEAVAGPRFLVQLFGLFAGLGLTMAAMGVYGIMVFHVSQRSREIGIRMALGAQSGGILRLVLVQSLARAGLGLAIGLACAFALTRLMERLLFETTPTDPATYFGVVAVLLGVVVLATLLPALRAVRTDKRVVLAVE